MTEDERFGAVTLKHLEMLQAVISRLGTDSFLIKGWAIRVAGIFFGFSVSMRRPLLAFASVVTTVMFWCLDTSFLRSERLFRALFNRVRLDPAELSPLFMDATGSEFLDLDQGELRKAVSWWKVFCRPTLILLYGGLVTAAAVIA